VGGDGRVLAAALGAGLGCDGVEEGVGHHGAALDRQLGQESLDPLAGLADQDAPDDGLRLARVLPDHEDARRAVEPAAVEDRAPPDPEVP
jgi:hypothetical protein